MSKGTKEQFMHKLLEGTKFDIVNGIGLQSLPNDRVAKLELKTCGTHQHYEKLTLKVLSKTEGVLDTVDFLFSENLVPDKKNKHQNAEFKRCKVVEYCGWGWYIDYPTLDSVKEMNNNIQKYLDYLV